MDQPELADSRMGQLGVVILEVESNPAGADSGNEWVRLLNLSDVAVDVSNWIIQSTHGRTQTHQIREGTVIEACGTAVIGFSSQFLDNDGESVVLLGLHGNMVDQTPVFDDRSNDSWTWMSPDRRSC